MKNRLVLITIVSITILGSIVTAIYAQGVVDPDGVPRCKGNYSEDCGPGKKRDVTCGPGGEFETHECKGSGGDGGSGDGGGAAGGGGQAEDKGECRVATIWNEAEQKCKGTATGTNKETQDEDPCPGCSEEVAARKDEPKIISRQEGNARRVSGPGGGGGGTASPTGTPVPTLASTIDGECTTEGTAKCWNVNANACEYRGCQVSGSCTLLGEGFIESNERPSTCTDANTTDTTVPAADAPSDPADYTATCSLACPNAQISSATAPVDATYVICHTSGGQEFSVRSGQSTQCPTNDPGLGVVPLNVGIIFAQCSTLQNTISSNALLGTADGQCIAGDDVLEYCLQSNYNAESTICHDTTQTPEPTEEPQGQTCKRNGRTSCDSQEREEITGSVGGTIVMIEGDDRITYQITGVEDDGSCSTPAIGGSTVQEDYCKAAEEVDGVSTDRVLGASTQTLNPGVYQVSGEGVESINIVINSDNVQLKFFADLNGDGIQQENEPDVDGSVLNIQISEDESSIVYNINKGWNLIGFEMISANWQTASKLMDEFDRKNLILTHTSTYTGGKWQTFSRRADETGKIVDFGDDFTIIPGKSYFIKAQDGGSITLTGNKFTQSVPLDLANGWNLVSVQSATEYKASAFLNKCVSGGIQCDSVARFDSGLYEVVVSKDGTFFGNDFNLIKKSGYFLRVQSGGGQRFTP